VNSLAARYLLFYPVHYAKRERIIYLTRKVEEINQFSRRDLDAYNDKKLRNVLSVACEDNRECYKYIRKLKHSIERDNVCIRKIITDIPLMKKEYIREEFGRRNDEVRIKTDIRTTSGSTGIPLRFYKDRYATGCMDAVMYSAYKWHGLEMGAPQARFWGMPIHKKDQRIAKVKDLLKNRIRFSAFELGKDAKMAFYRLMKRFRPNYFYGYTSLISEYCRFLRDEKMGISDIPLKVVIGTGEFASDGEINYIKESLGVSFVNEYGCTEVGIIGFECEHSKMHTMASNVYVEVINSGFPVLDKEGDIVVTELNAKINPFIRYSLGDRGILSTERCRCGRDLPVIRIISGRKDEYILTPDGRKIYDAIFAYILKRGVNQFKAIQKEPRRIEIYVVVNDEYTPMLECEYAKDLKKALGCSMEITFLRVGSIPRDESGKLRYFERRF
jgi:phenylacetate-CoA ligase